MHVARLAPCIESSVLLTSVPHVRLVTSIPNRLQFDTWYPWWTFIPQDLYNPCFNLTNYARTLFTPTMISRRLLWQTAERLRPEGSARRKLWPDVWVCYSGNFSLLVFVERNCLIFFFFWIAWDLTFARLAIVSLPMLRFSQRGQWTMEMPSTGWRANYHSCMGFTIILTTYVSNNHNTAIIFQLHM